jgi:hypothetical protein
MRSSGVADLSKIEKARTNARTRLLWISNPRSDQQLASYNFGVYAIKELIGSLEDIRRFDMAIMVASGEVSRSVLNMRDKDQPNCPHTFKGDLCRNLILWAWSRRPDQIKFEDGAIEAILDASESMGKKFVSNIPLVEPADQRHKLARAACAIAARTFSCDDDGCLVVRKGHAHFVHEFLDRIYSTSIFGYKEYSDLIRGETELKDGEEVEGFLSRVPNSADVIRNLLEWSGFSYTDWIDVTEHDRDTARTSISFLVRKNAIRRGRGGLYFKTPAFIALIRKMEMSGGLENRSLSDMVNDGEI